MILSEDALATNIICTLSTLNLKGNGDKFVKECLSTLESVTSWLDIRMKLAVESRTRVRGTV